MLRFSSMLCSSPITEKTSSKRAASLPSAAGMGRPDWAMSVRRPSVFRATVLPPALAPLMIRVRMDSPIRRSTGTT